MRYAIITTLCLLFLVPVSNALGDDQQPGATVGNAPPKIEVPEQEYDFGELYEDKMAVHEFTVKNTGGSPLVIERVAKSCGCTVANYDEEIPPGGEGKVAIRVRLKGFTGSVIKTATVFCNDPATNRVVLTIKGKVKTYLNVQPSHLFFRGRAEDLQPVRVDVTSESGPFTITKLQSNIEDQIEYRKEEIEPGKHYVIEVANKAPRGKYHGQISIATDNPGWPEVQLRVLAMIETTISVRPSTVYVGKFREDKPIVIGRVKLKHQKNADFTITRLEYDQTLLKITEHPAKSGKGLTLEVEPLLDNIPNKERRKTDIKIETDAEPGETHIVQVEIANL